MTAKKLYLFTFLFCLAFAVHLLGINRIGRTWDEQYKVDFGYIAWTRLLAHDFSLAAWNQGGEHPMVAKYLYGMLMRPGMIPIRVAPNTILPVSDSDLVRISSGSYLKTILYDTEYVIPYDYTLPRVFSAFCNITAVILTVILAAFFLESLEWSIIAGVFLVFTPRFVYLGQLVTFESITVALFMTTLLVFKRLLTNPQNVKYHLLIGILCGLLFWTRYNNIVIFPLLFGWGVIHYLYYKERDLLTPKFLLIPLIAFILGISIWPLTWHEFPKYLLSSFSFHEKRFVGVSFYYWKYFFVTTPLPFLLGIPLGVYFLIKKRIYWHSVMLWMLGFIVVFHSFFVFQLGGTRYLVILYPLLAITATYGYYQLFKHKQLWVMLLLLLFMAVDQSRFSPYYLDYYNQFVGGASGAIRAGYEFSWWGEGQKEASSWINSHLPPGSTVGLITTPKYVFPAMENGLVNKQNVDEKSTADYLVISRPDAHHLTPTFWQSHEVIHQVSVDNEWLVEVVKKK